MSTWNDPPGGFHPISAPDFLPREQLTRIQLQRLQSVVTRAFDRVPLFRTRMEERGLAPASVASLDDIAALPLEVQAELSDAAAKTGENTGLTLMLALSTLELAGMLDTSKRRRPARRSLLRS